MSQTWRDSTGSSWKNRVIQLVLLLAPLGSGLAWQRVRPDSVVGQSYLSNAELTLISALAGFGALMVLFFLWHLIIAVPYQIWREEKERADAREIGQPSPAPDYLQDALARRKAEALAEAMIPRPKESPRLADDGFKKRLEHLAAESAKRCPETPMWQAIEYVRGIIGDADFQNCYPEARRQIRQAALEDRLEVWGRKEILPSHMTADQGASSAWTRIDPQYWQTHELSSLAIGAMFEDRDHTWVEGDVRKIGDRYWSLKVRMPQVDRLWRETRPNAKLAEERRQQINALRDAATAYGDGPDFAFRGHIEAVPEYARIRGHLSEAYLIDLQRSQRTAWVRPSGARNGHMVNIFLDEMDRLEKEWKL